MAAPARYMPIIESPKPSDYKDIITYQRDYDMWKRSGGLEAAVVDLKGLTASVAELNTMVGIDTDTTTQAQIDLKANKAELGTISSQNANSVSITGGAISGVTISDSSITLLAGNSSTVVYPGGTLNVNVTTVGNVGAGVTNLMSYTLPANSLGANKDSYEIDMWGTFAANANVKTLTVEYGSDTLYDNGGAAINSGSWSLKTLIVRTASNAQTCFTTAMSDNVLLVNESRTIVGAQDVTTTIVFKVTAQGVADNDIVQNGLMIKWWKTA